MRNRKAGPSHRPGMAAPTPAEKHSGSAPSDLGENTVRLFVKRQGRGRRMQVDCTVTRDEYYDLLGLPVPEVER